MLLITIPFNFFVHGAPNDFRRYTIFGLKQLLDKHNLHINKHLLIGGIWITTANNIITHLGFRKSHRYVRMFLNGILFVANALALMVVKLSKPSQMRDEINPAEHDRRNPLSIVATAVNQKENDDVPENIVACPKCHGQLDLTGNVSCRTCKATFGRCHNIPVLADEADIHA